MQSSEAIGNGILTRYHYFTAAPQWLYRDRESPQEYCGPYSSELEAVAVAAHSAELALEG